VHPKAPFRILTEIAVNVPFSLLCPSPTLNLQYCEGKTRTRDSMQLWANTVNDSKYTFDEMLPFYKRSIDFTPSGMQGSRQFHSWVQLWRIWSRWRSVAGSYTNYAQPSSSWMNLGMEAIGIKWDTVFQPRLP